MKRQVFRLTEEDLQSVIRESVNQIIKEGGVLKKKSPYYYMTRKIKCPKCGGEGNNRFGGLCLDCARSNNIEQQNRV